jgi:CBS domain-containing protein
MKVRDLMAKDIAELRPVATVDEAAKLMASRNVSTVVITDAGRLKGLLTDRKMVTHCLAKGKNPALTKVKEIMTPFDPNASRLVAVDPEMDAFDAARLMRRHKVRRLPVIEDGRLVGMLSIADLARDLRSYLSSILEEIAKAEK